MKMIGKILSVSELNVEVLCYDKSLKVNDVLAVNIKNNIYKFQVVELNNMIATTIPLDSVIGLSKGIEVQKISEGLSIEYSDQILGKVFGPYGNLIDNNVIESVNKRDIKDKDLNLSEINVDSDIVITNERHKIQIQKAITNLNKSIDSLNKNMPIDIVAISLKDVLSDLGEITGEEASEEIINEIFSRFCLGK